MKKFTCLICLVCLAIFFTFAGTARAEKVNMGTLTCGDFSKMDGEEIAMLYFWLDGYLSKASGNTVLDTDSVENDLKSLADACAASPNEKILSVLSGN
jgi:hypothetical protein